MKKLGFFKHNCIWSKTALLVGALTMSCCLLQANWEPDSCLMDLDQSAFKALEDKNYINLKTTILDGLKNSWCSQEKANLLMDLTLLTRPEVCVEIGACTGSSVLPVAATLKYLKKGHVIAIDGWSNDVVIRNLDLDDANRAWWATVDMDNVYKAYEHLLNHFSVTAFSTPIRKASEEAVHEIDSIDFLHLDGDYSSIGSVRDVELYLPKVKSGGFVLISNLFTMVKGQAPKLKAFVKLFETCDVICEIENDNAVLFVKR